jgi:beta-phosphoglucomutase-like phosphatase (HAD superfamily)
MIPPHFPPLVRAVVFDFDETMIDLEAQHTYASAELCRARGDDYERMPEAFRRGSGRRVIDDVRELREFFGWSEPVEQLFAERQRYFDRACGIGAPAPEPPLRLMRGVDRIARALHANGATLAVTSSAVGSSIDEILRQTGLRELFALIVDGSEVTNGKPDPEAYLITLRRLGREAAECVVIEDSHVGVVAAKRAGIYCIAVRNPNAGTWQDLSAADLELASLDELDAEWFTTGS